MKKIFKAKDDCRGMSTGEIISTIFERRGIEDYPEFLHPTVDDLIPYEKLRNIENAFKIVDNGVNQSKTFLVYADVDTDGCSAGSIMYRYLRNFTDKVKITINEGKKHGITDYDIAKCDADIVIIVDSINDGECYNKFIEAGKSVIVLDHHIIPDDINESIILVSSANNYPNSQLSGAGVTWKFCKYCDEMFLTDYADSLVDLAACGIIADMCDMSVPENRYICNLGFENLHNTGIKAVLGNYKFNSKTVSFSIAPLVNAANRLNQNELALELFLSDNKDEVKKIVKSLKSLKEEQNKIVSDLMEQINKQAETQANNKVMIFEINNESEAGVSGLMGNKLTGIYQRPVIVVGKTDDGYFGSGRGYGTEDFRQMCENCNVFAQGHENAFGIEIYDLNDFHSKIENELINYEFKVETTADVVLNAEQITNDLIDNFKTINKISGEGFKPLTVMITGITDYTVGNMSNFKHLKVNLGEICLIKWNFCGDWEELDGRPLTVIGELDSGFFGRTFYKQLIINDYKVGE